MTVVELCRVGRSYRTVTALSGVDLVIGAGELVGVVGPSGSGKSTLLQIMGTLDRPSTGRVLVDGLDTTGLTDTRLAGLRAHRIGFVFQQFHLHPALTAVDNVGTGLLYRGTIRAERRRRAVEALHRVGLGHRLSHRPGQLSGGECQRVAIARAIVGRPAVVLADEPTGNLDSRAGAEVMTLLHALNTEGSTVVVITHDQALAVDLPRRIHLRDGAIVHDDAASGGVVR
jgi:putative ABC transport system ATP-binding protein